MFNYKINQLNSKTLKIQLYQQEKVLSIAQVWELWEHSQEFCQFYDTLLSGIPFKAFFWEHPPFIWGNLEQAYEVVLIETAAFEQLQANVQAFASHFQAEKAVVGFGNLRNDAWLLAPCPLLEYEEAYVHLANFIRMAAEEQRRALWQSLALALKTWVPRQKTWLSTSGLGISWLHVRLDQRPKYYHHKAYKTL